jgi:hypothetical protein
LAWAAKADEIDSIEVVGADLEDVIESLCIGPMRLEHSATMGFQLDLPHGLAAERAFEAQLKAADAGAEGTEPHERASRLFAHVEQRFSAPRSLPPTQAQQ